MRWLLVAAVVIAASVSVSGLGQSTDDSTSSGPPDSFSFNVVEVCEDYLDPEAWAGVAAVDGAISTPVATRFSLAATACSGRIDEAADAAALGLEISNAAALRRLVQVTQTE